MQKPWYVADPVHQMLDFGRNQETVKALVAAEPFQRLRRISQLGLASFVFPGAVHTRFAHSLGAAHLATLVAASLGEKISPSDTRTVVCAALLHDIGHGPFSHSFERSVKKILSGTVAASHEEWTVRIIRERLGEQLRALDVDPERVVEMVHATKPEHDIPLFMRQIISSQLDVDRMDYLCRDAHFAGVSIGQIDVQYLIRCLRVISHGSQRTLGVTAKGVACYEAFVLSRHLMNKSVYYHKQVATFESMMEECLRLLVDEGDTYMPRFLTQVRGLRHDTGDPEDLFDSYLSLTEDQVWTALTEAAVQDQLLGKLAARLLRRIPVPSFRVASGKHEILEKELGSRFSSNQYAVRTLASSPYKQASGEQVFVLDEGSGVAVHISEKSSIVDTLRDRADTEAVLVVFDEAAAGAIESAATQADCLQAPRRRISSPPSNRPPLAKTSADGGKTDGTSETRSEASG